MLLLGDCNDWLKEINDESIDLIVSDPPYGIEFMGKDWDKALVSVDIWKECFRVLKEGKLAFVMCSPRQDVLSRMIVNLQDAGFRTNYTSIYWTYASGFPKAANVSKLLDKRNGKTDNQFLALANHIKETRIKQGLSSSEVVKLFQKKSNRGCFLSLYETAERIPTPEIWSTLKEILHLDNRFDELIERTQAEREIISKGKSHVSGEGLDNSWNSGYKLDYNITRSATEAAKKMEGAYVGFQPKPAVEVILVVSKGKTLTWLDDCRIPYQSEDDKALSNVGFRGLSSTGSNEGWKRQAHDDHSIPQEPNEKGRFPANLLSEENLFGDYSRYFSLDAWADKTFPFIITPKASRSERNKGCEDLPSREFIEHDNPARRKSEYDKPIRPRQNHHPTVKPIKLMSYLITMGSREGDLVLDPFCGSGTVCIAAHNLHRKWLGIEMNPEYTEIIKSRLSIPLSQLKLTGYLEDEISHT